MVPLLGALQLEGTQTLLDQTEKEEAVPLGAGNLLGNSTERCKATAIVLKPIVESLHDNRLSFEVLDQETSRHRQARVVSRRYARGYRVLGSLPTTASVPTGSDSKRRIPRNCQRPPVSRFRQAALGLGLHVPGDLPS